MPIWHIRSKILAQASCLGFFFLNLTKNIELPVNLGRKGWSETTLSRPMPLELSTTNTTLIGVILVNSYFKTNRLGNPAVVMRHIAVIYA